MKRKVLLVSCVILSACTGMDPLSSTNPNWVFTAAGPARIGDLLDQPDTPLFEFYSAYIVSRCSAAAIPENVPVNIYEASDDDETKVTTKTVTCKDINDDSNTTSHSFKAQQFARSGFRVADSVCASYFRRLGNQDQDLDFYSESATLLSGLTTGVLGLTDTPAQTISIVGTTFSALTSGLESFDTIYHFAPDLNEVESLVSRARLEYESELFSSENTVPQDYYDAVRAIETYQRICQTSHIRSLVNQAIGSAEVRAEVSGADIGLAASTQQTILSNQQIQSATTALGYGPLTDQSIAWLTKFDRGGIVGDDANAAFANMLDLVGIDPQKATDPVSGNVTYGHPWQPTMRTWLDTLRTNDPETYANLVSRADRLLVTNLPGQSNTDVSSARQAFFFNDQTNSTGRATVQAPSIAPQSGGGN